EHGDGDAGGAGEAERGDDFGAAAGFDQPVGRPANPERGERRQGHMGAGAFAEHRTEGPLEIVEPSHDPPSDSSTMSACSRATSAAIACRRSHTVNLTRSPGPSCPA